MANGPQLDRNTKGVNRIILVQHCQSQHHLDRDRYFPDSDNGLTELGRAQAEAVANRVADLTQGAQVRLFSSDMTRARETAEIVAAEIHCKPSFQPELREWSDPNILEHKTRPEWSDAQALTRETSSDWTGRLPKEHLFDWRPYDTHETWREFLARISAFMDPLANELDEETLPVLVLHGGSLSNVVVWWLGLPLDSLPDRYCFGGRPGNISILKTNRHGNPVIDRLNDTAHLDALGNGV